jgi:hypothetical protein
MKRLLLWAGLFTSGLTIGLAVALLIAARERKRYSESNSKPVVLVVISAIIDGSERFVFTADNVSNIHGQWSPPQNVIFNGESWRDLSAPPPGWLEMARELDLTNASIVARKGRDVIALERTADGFELIFADTQMGAGPYEVTISIPHR